MEIRRAVPDDLDACRAILVALPDHFDDNGREGVDLDGDRLAWVAVVDGEIVGFVLTEQRYETSVEITHAGVLPDRHRTGIGRALVGEALTWFESTDVVVVEVKTLDASADYEPYVPTRRFWEHCGFRQIDCIEDLPGWGPENPAAIYVAALAPTR